MSVGESGVGHAHVAVARPASGYPSTHPARTQHAHSTYAHPSRVARLLVFTSPALCQQLCQPAATGMKLCYHPLRTSCQQQSRNLSQLKPIKPPKPRDSPVKVSPLLVLDVQPPVLRLLEHPILRVALDVRVHDRHHLPVEQAGQEVLELAYRVQVAGLACGVRGWVGQGVEAGLWVAGQGVVASPVPVPDDHALRDTCSQKDAYKTMQSKWQQESHTPGGTSGTPLGAAAGCTRAGAGCAERAHLAAAGCHVVLHLDGVGEVVLVPGEVPAARQGTGK